MSNPRPSFESKWRSKGCANPGVRAVVASLFLTFLLANVWLMSSPVQAQQSGVEPYQVIAGPYRIEVIANQSSLSLGSVRYTVAVLNAENSRPVSDAQVVIRARHQESGTEGWATALNSPVTPERYQAQIELNQPGSWLVSVDVTSPLGRVEVEAPSQQVPEPSQSRAGGLVFAGITVVLILGSVYLVWSIRRAQQKREAINAH
jgi:hypothetical protein